MPLTLSSREGGDGLEGGGTDSARGDFEPSGWEQYRARQETGDSGAVTSLLEL